MYIWFNFFYNSILFNIINLGFFFVLKNVNVGDKVFYGFYGVVEYSGSMRGGYYIVYVKVRIFFRRLLEYIIGKRNVFGMLF